MSNEHPMIQFTKIIRNQTHRLEQVTTQLLDFARPLYDEFSKQNINLLLEKVLLFISPQIERLEIEKNISLKTDLPLIYMNKHEMEQLLLNLMMNALESMQAGNILSIRTDFEKETKRIILQVSDTGKGIYQNEIENIFEPYYTTKIRGSGLGLAIVKRIVEHHNGEIKVESNPKMGTRFTLFFPSI